MDPDYCNYSKGTYCLMCVLRQQTLKGLSCDWLNEPLSKAQLPKAWTTPSLFFCACTFFLSVEMEVYFPWMVLCENVHIPYKVNLSTNKGTNCFAFSLDSISFIYYLFFCSLSLIIKVLVIRTWNPSCQEAGSKQSLLLKQQHNWSAQMTIAWRCENNCKLSWRQVILYLIIIVHIFKQDFVSHWDGQLHNLFTLICREWAEISSSCQITAKLIWKGVEHGL